MNEQESMPIFAVVIPVLHSIGNLERCISSLADIDYPKDGYQVVLVDCLVVDGVKSFSENLPDYGFRITTLRLPELPDTEYSWFAERRLNEAWNFAVKKIRALYYVFTEDDCTFYPEWLRKFEAVMSDEVGAACGPDILPDGMEWFPNTIDAVLNSYMGSAGMRRRDGLKGNIFNPRKQNMVIPASVFDRVGYFNDMPIGGELDYALRIRRAGLQIRFFPENPVLHRRVASLSSFVRVTAFLASAKVKLMRGKNVFTFSPHFFVLLATLVGALIGIFSVINSFARTLFEALIVVYIVSLTLTMVSSSIKKWSIPVGAGVFLIMPLHHLSIVIGVIKGTISKVYTN
jgi:glycosyltransferase involved in cell wall biosynthesis